MSTSPPWQSVFAPAGTLAARGIGRSNAYPYLMAVSTLVTLPILLAFFFAQRTFIEGITLTGMKG
jgi:multiple sugar transport system permease protein